MAKLTINRREIEAPEGAPLVEVIKQNGFYISDLCYIDGLPPYAGCRTCLVEIEGAPGLQLACTTQVRDGMVVRTDTPEVREARQAVLSIINANHSDRCLTCHRRVRCMPGDICLRDDVVTHRCVTCAKNYRCELQTTNELLKMESYEPWEGEERTYYQKEPPEPDRVNPFLEFDPQMCIICTRCVRACHDIRHTGAITLACRGYETRIAFGVGGAVHESNCDFCGACLDVCPTATLMEKPNKWIARTEDWVSTTCNSCSVGCTISMGVRDGRAVIVKPDRLNPVSDDQICVRGRFHYDAIKDSEHLSRPLLRRDQILAPSSWEEALETAAERLAQLREQHGPGAIAFLGSPFATNEENYLLQKLAREIVGSAHIDFTVGPVARATAEALTAAFGTEALPADMADIASARTLLVVADDLESSHNVAALRVKDAVVRNGARLIVVSPRYGEVCDFAEPYGGVWLRPEPGGEAAAVASLAAALAARHEFVAAAEAEGLSASEAVTRAPKVPGVETETLERAAAILAQAAADRESGLAVIYAPNHIGAVAAGETARAVANIALLCRGREGGARSLHLLPVEANVNGARDMGVVPDLLPGRRPVEGKPGLGFQQIVKAAGRRRIRALVVLRDNPLMFAPAKGTVREALGKLDFLLVIDDLLTDTAKLAHVVLPDVPAYAREGTFTSADRRVLRLRPAVDAPGEARPAWRALIELGQRLSTRLSAGVEFSYDGPAAVMEEIGKVVPAYAPFRYDAFILWGKGRALDGAAPERAVLQLVAAPEIAPADGTFALLTGRTLYTSLEGACLHLPEADKLQREEFVEVHPADAADLRIGQGQQVTLANGTAELALPVRLTEAVPRGAVFVPLYYDGGAVTALVAPEDGLAGPPRIRLAPRSDG
ncbi:MAG: molybdopterin-dependent oxidoreductase [Dehalococcoidia bacterium]